MDFADRSEGFGEGSVKACDGQMGSGPVMVRWQLQVWQTFALRRDQLGSASQRERNDLVFGERKQVALESHDEVGLLMLQTGRVFEMQLQGRWAVAHLSFQCPAMDVNCEWSEVDTGIEARVTSVALVHSDMLVKSGVPNGGELIVRTEWHGMLV